MPPRSRGHGDADQPDGTPARQRGGRPTAAGNMEEFEGTVREVSEGGRSTANGGTGGGTSSGPTTAQADPLVTSRTGTPGGQPDGRPTRYEPDDDTETKRSIEMENSGAATLADQGWRIKQNPSKEEVAQARQETGDTGNADSNPDYILEGRVFDALSPTKPTKSVRNIWSDVEVKVLEKEQTQRVVLNLEDWRGDLSALRKQFADWPMQNLKEVKAITADGEIVQIDLP